LKLVLKKIMAEKSLTTAELAQKSGLSETYIRDLLADKKSPTLRTVAKLAEALKTTPGHLLPTAKKASGE